MGRCIDGRCREDAALPSRLFCRYSLDYWRRGGRSICTEDEITRVLQFGDFRIAASFVLGDDGGSAAVLLGLVACRALLAGDLCCLGAFLIGYCLAAV